MIPCASLPHPEATNGQTVYFVMEKLSVDHGSGGDIYGTVLDDDNDEYQ